MIEVAIVGGGPAGSYCAYNLARMGFSPTVFDHTHPREKPCGGFVTPLAQELFPFLNKLPIAHCKRTQIRLVPPSGKAVFLSTRGRLRCFSRLKLDQCLLDMALNEGARLIKEKVATIAKKGDLWGIETSRGTYSAKIMVGADGVNSLVRRYFVGPLSNVDRGFCFGYFVKGLEKEEMTIRFLAHRKGYLWIMPRDDHTSVGIGTADLSTARGLRQELDHFVDRNYPSARRLAKWAALIPNVKNSRTFCTPVAGSSWILIGDAAAHVNPVLGEGIPYALLDGKLAAKAIAENEPEGFDRLWKEEYGKGLLFNVRLRKWLYSKAMLELYCVLLKRRNRLHI